MKKIVVILILFIAGCDDIFEKDISTSMVEIIAPKYGVSVVTGDVTFSWNEVKGATGYILQIVTPSFDRTQAVIVDTVLNVDSLHRGLSCKIAIPVGEYQWSIRAKNYSSSGQETVRTLQVISGEAPINDISQSAVDIIALADGVCITEGEVTFSWNELEGATSYVLRVVSPSFGNAAAILTDVVITPESAGGSLNYKLTIPYGEYQWSIRAKNSKYSSIETIRSLHMLSKEPVVKDISKSTVNIIGPTNGATINEGELTFSWNELDGATSYTLRVVSPTFDNATTVLANVVMYPESLGGSFNYKLTVPKGEYQWSIQAHNPLYQSIETVRTLHVLPKEPAVKDISTSTVHIVAPANGISITEGEVTFCWDEVDGAASYKLRVVAPSFDNVATVLADVVINAESSGGSLNYKLSLPKGDYQWSIQARNSVYRSVETVRSLHVLPKEPTAKDISGSTVHIVAPANGITVPEGEITFGWDEVDGATGYTLRVVTPSFDNAATILADVVISSGGSLNYKLLLPPGVYQWSIRAKNSVYRSIETIRTLTVIPANP